LGEKAKRDWHRLEIRDPAKTEIPPATSPTPTIRALLPASNSRPSPDLREALRKDGAVV
jgi:hypothetical protein